MRKKRPQFIACFRTFSVAAVFGVILVLCGSTLALADGMFELKIQTAAAHTDSVPSDAPQADDACPFCPDTHHSEADHTCGCSHFYTSPVQPFVLDYSPILLSQEFSDPVCFLPDVFLERFIPPQITS